MIYNPLRLKFIKYFKGGDLLIVGAFFLVLVQMYMVQERVADYARAVPCPISYPSTWVVEKHEYKQGDWVKLHYTREYDGDELPLMMLTVDSIENVETHEVYPGAILVRVITKQGMQEIRTVRQLPRNIEPGTYIIEGWASGQTSIRSSPARYSSEPFMVVSKSQTVREKVDPNLDPGSINQDIPDRVRYKPDAG